MDFLSHELVIPPATEPVDRAALKRQLRLPANRDTEDDHLDLLIEAAREHMETATSRAFITQTWRVTLNAFPRYKSRQPWWDGVRQGAINMFDHYSPLVLPRRPVQSVSAIRTHNSLGVASIVDPAIYQVNRYEGQILLQSGRSWPSGYRPQAGIEIDYVVGYGDALTVPASLRMATLQLAAHWYENRVPVQQGSGVSTTEVPLMVSQIIERHKVKRV